VKPHRCAYDLALNTKTKIPELTIAAIILTASAWDKVSINTIQNSWKKTQVLSQSNMDIDNEMNAFLNFNEEEVGNDDNIQHLIDRLPISDPLTADQFIQIDNSQEIFTDQEIIDMVQCSDEPDEPDEPEEQFPVVKSGEAVHGADNY